MSDARRACLERLIDHAPLFPPASMAMPEALDEDRRARASEQAFMLGRFVCPASKVDELGGEERALSLVLDGPAEQDHRVEALETRAPDGVGELAGLASEVYVELPLGEDLEQRLDELARQGLRAKVRCGGAHVPSAGELAQFIRGCRERGLVFKATAGLHHAYPTLGEHGFLNLLAAAVFGDEERALAAERGAFVLTTEGFRWDGREADAAELERTRRELFHSIGSCSFFEPVEELRALGVLPL